jgi:hypothetical protein
MKNYLEILKSAAIETLAMSLDQCHADGLFSLVFDGTEHGQLTRAFIAKKGLKPFEVQLHSHRYGIKLTVVKGLFRHHVAKPSASGDVWLREFQYLSPLNGGIGLTKHDPVCFKLTDYLVPPSAEIHLNCDVIHTVSCEPGTIWIVEELGFEANYSFAYGKEFVTENLYLKPSQYQVNDAVQVVMRALA